MEHVSRQDDKTENPGERRKEKCYESETVIQGGTLLTMVEGCPPIHDAHLIIKGNRITDIRSGNHPDNSGAEFIDARNGLIMPGLVNAHGHTAMTLFRGFADDLPLKEWLFTKIFPAESAFLNPNSVYWAALLGCLEMIRSGTTTVSDGYFYQDATVEAFEKAGLRALVAQGIIDFPAPGVPDPAENLKAGRRFIDRWIRVSDLIRPGLFCHSLTTCSERTLQEAMQISHDFSLPLQIHLSETKGEVDEVLRRTGKRPAFYLDSLGLLSENLIAVHGVHLQIQEIGLIGSRGTGIVHCPESNMKLASGVAKTSRMIEMGLQIGLGTDGAASNNDLDLFREMDTAAKLAKVYSLNPLSMSAGTVLKMATVWGARILGLEKEIGTLEIGKKADVIVIDLGTPHLTPLYNPYSSLVYAASGDDVKDVIVDGKILMKNRQLTCLDCEEIMARVKEISANISL
ncbi:MAG: amidohydrolase [Deltaproteobacteria bacterium]|nr:amidohydrolase [Deltaproteobacteria bacterium]